MQADYCITGVPQIRIEFPPLVHRKSNSHYNRIDLYLIFLRISSFSFLFSVLISVTPILKSSSLRWPLSLRLCKLMFFTLYIFTHSSFSCVPYPGKMADFPSSKISPSRIARSILKIAGLGKREASSQTRQLRQSDEKENSLLLEFLPVEILHMIVNQLDVVDQVCLQNTDRFFRHLIKVDRTALEGDRCRKWAITCRLETDMKKYPAKVACAFCKTVRKRKLFRDVQEWTLFSIEGKSLHLRHRFGSAPVWGMMTHPPNIRWCRVHNKDRFSSLRTLEEKSSGPFLREPTTRPRWTRFQVLRCWHCAQCIPDEDGRKTGCLQCLCDFCPRLVDFHHFRTGACEPEGGQYRYEFVRQYEILPANPPRGPSHMERRFVAEVGSEYCDFN